jgi:anti-sigma regulatory factor (Ser/Thr protein kinase)/anti-anti-sigma regulatory factor
MTKLREKSRLIQAFIVDKVGDHPGDITHLVCKKFGISRQAANRHLRRLIEVGLITAKGATRSRQYSLKPIVDEYFVLPITPDLDEDKVWRDQVRPCLTGIPENVMNICHHGFTEMFNNVIDHSEGQEVRVSIKYTPATIGIRVYDDGVGVFNKIKSRFELDDERHAMLELSKGKLTTDPERHTGEGIFFTSRMFDDFMLVSGAYAFKHFEPNDDWMFEDENSSIEGTIVNMLIGVHSKRTTRKVFDKYTSKDGSYSFDRTHVPVALAKYGDDNLISRSQAKRLLVRFERFKEVFLDFRGVNMIGQAFADEIFRVFKKNNPQIRLVWIYANKEVLKMIIRAVDSSG